MKKKLIDLTELEKVNTLKLRDICYTDSAPTTWTRSLLKREDIVRGLIPYFCESCGHKSYYILKQPYKDNKRDRE